MKKKKLFRIVCLLIIIIALSLGSVFYLTRKEVYDYVIFEEIDIDETNRGEEMIGMNIVGENKLKIRYDISVEAGNMEVSLYRVPEDHLRYKLHKGEVEVDQVYGTEEYKKAMHTTEDFEKVYTVTLSESGSTEIDTADFSDGYYIISEKSSEDAVIRGTSSLYYVRYNWMKVAEKFSDEKNYYP